MKIFIGQAVTGEDMDRLKEEMNKIYVALENICQEHYCTFMEGDSFEKKSNVGKLEHAFKIIDKHDTFLAIVRSEKRSEGMLMEIGYSLAKGKKIILAVNKNVKDTRLREVADKIIEFDDVGDLCNKLKELK